MIYPSIRIEGAILSADLLDQLEDKTGQNPKDFGLGSNVRVKDEIARTFAEAQSLWKMFQRKLETLPRNSVGTSETRNVNTFINTRWIRHFTNHAMNIRST